MKKIVNSFVTTVEGENYRWELQSTASETSRTAVKLRNHAFFTKMKWNEPIFMVTARRNFNWFFNVYFLLLVFFSKIGFSIKSGRSR